MKVFLAATMTMDISADSGKVYTTLNLEQNNYIQCLFLHCLFSQNNAMVILIKSE